MRAIDVRINRYAFNKNTKRDMECRLRNIENYLTIKDIFNYNSSDYRELVRDMSGYGCPAELNVDYFCNHCQNSCTECWKQLPNQYKYDEEDDEDEDDDYDDENNDEDDD